MSVDGEDGAEQLAESDRNVVSLSSPQHRETALTQLITSIFTEWLLVGSRC